MDTYRMINKELSINNQELRNAVNKLKKEIIYLNRMLFEQREEFLCLRATIAKTIEQKYQETMTLIYPDKLFPDQKQISKLDIKSLRRSNGNATAADPINNRSQSPPATANAASASTSPDNDDDDNDLSLDQNKIVEESTFRKSIPSIIIEQSSRLSKSPAKSLHSGTNQISTRRCEDFKDPRKPSENPDFFEDSEMSQTLLSTNTSLNTIREEKSGVLDVNCETLSDATINCLLDAPCSTPYNHNKSWNETPIQMKEVRVKIKKLSEEQLSDPSCLHFSENPTTTSRLRNSTFKTKNAQIEACHTEREFSQIDSLSNFKIYNNSTLKLEPPNRITEEDKPKAKPAATPKKTTSKRAKKGKKNVTAAPAADTNSDLTCSDEDPIIGTKRRVPRTKNCFDTDSDVTCSDEETTKIVDRRRLRHKPISFKEPNLKSKMRNASNKKF